MDQPSVFSHLGFALLKKKKKLHIQYTSLSRLNFFQFKKKKNFLLIRYWLCRNFIFVPAHVVFPFYLFIFMVLLCMCLKTENYYLKIFIKIRVDEEVYKNT